MIDVLNVNYTRGKRMLLNDISFAVSAGELVSIIGPNGAGKSTLLKIIGKDITAYSGSVKLNGRLLTTYDSLTLAKQRAVLAQQTHVSGNISVFELVLMGRYPYFGLTPTTKDIDIVHAVLDSTGMLSFSRRLFNQLSGGEQQRVQMARVLAQIHEVEGALVLLDEPTTGLDILYQQQIMTIAKNLAHKGHTVISVLHDMGFAAFYSDKILILKDGNTIAFDRSDLVLTEQHLELAFGLKIKPVWQEGLGYPIMVPQNYFNI